MPLVQQEDGSEPGSIQNQRCHNQKTNNNGNNNGNSNNSFGSIRTNICMVGPHMDDEECGLLGESPSSSRSGGGGTLFGGPSSCSERIAHGILCPETVLKMEKTTQGGRSNRAIKAFLDRYRRHGPMSCMELLSDPEILPHLTTAMRGLA